MENKKMTKKDVFAYIAEKMATDEMVVNFCHHEIEQLENKASKKGQTETQKENELIKVQLIQALKNIGEPVTISELQKQSPEIAMYSNQKLSALFRQLLDKKQVIKIIDKKKSYFSVSNAEVVDGD